MHARLVYTKFFKNYTFCLTLILFQFQCMTHTKQSKCNSKLNNDRCVLLSHSMSQRKMTMNPLRLVSQEATVYDTCGNLDSIHFISWLVNVLLSANISVLWSLKKTAPPVRSRSSLSQRYRFKESNVRIHLQLFCNIV